jgi:uncharacterized repeat protein (TIGR03803 family)
MAKHFRFRLPRTGLPCAALLALGLGLSLLAAPPITFTDLHDFNGGAGDPTTFNSGRMAQGRDGNFYAESGNGGTAGAGTIFKLAPTGTVTIIHSLISSDGTNPVGGITLGTDGNFYGNGFSGGSSGDGTAFKVTPSGTLTVLHNFTNTGDGGNPVNALVLGTNGSFYGTTDASPGPATIYQVTPAGTFSTIHTLTTAEGFQGGQLSVGSDGNLYGAMNFGGLNGFGTNFKVTPGGVLTVLHNFDNTDGAEPAFGSAQAANGKFYGGASLGGSANAGVIYSLTTSGTFTPLYNVNGGTDGSEVIGQLLLASDGNFYSTTTSGGSSGCGTIFKVTPAGAYSVVHNFDSTHGCNSSEQVIQGTNGLLYGLVTGGGAHGNGVFYSLNLGLHAFAGLVTTTAFEGGKIGILGQGFSAASVVKFDGVPAITIAVTGSTFILATVPTGALTGAVTVTSGSTTLTSTQRFRVKPTVTSFTPPSGPVGTSVMITGTGLMQTTKVTFGGVAATTFTVNSDTQVTATVPTGAVTGKITITTPGGAATSTGTFTVN